jgi:hypothetical protein
LQKGDRNTKFFHSWCSERKRRNKIGRLRKEDGGWVEDEVEKQEFISNHFVQLFRSGAMGDTHQLLQAVSPRVSEEMNNALMSPFSAEEVKKALDSIGDLKAPGPDSMPAIFYKKFWATVGEQVTQEVLAVLNGGDMPAKCNDMVIALIPKVKEPDKVTDLRPISLCNVVYKLISKVLANQLKTILPDIISPTQSAFVPGRLISDNILTAYELTHHLLNKKKGNTGFAAIKLDMSKAYDRVEWQFLEQMMMKLGFCQAWIKLMMNCVSTMNYQIKVNGVLSSASTPERGLWQGDPLSPYLFLLCAEGFSSLLSKAENDGLISGVKICCPQTPAPVAGEEEHSVEHLEHTHTNTNSKNTDRTR